MSFESEIDKRRTFAIIAHPDAGKTTLTEKLLLFGGAIELAGAVKAKGDRRRARSDWMKVEQERGISVASSVMMFEHNNKVFNLLDTPGHEDFSEDTYRVLTAVDSAVMVLDAAKGIEAQTYKLFEVCRLRDVPIITFINKMDREGREPLDLLDEVEKRLALDVTPASWPIGMGRDFKGCYDLIQDQLILFDRTKGDKMMDSVQCNGLSDPKIDELLGAEIATKLRNDVEMVRGLCKPFDLQSYLEGHMTPVFFGSAVNNFGVRELLNGIGVYAPPPRSQKSLQRDIDPKEKKVTAFVFKIQANMDPKHHDRIAFARICSGEFKKGMKLKHVRTGKIQNIHSPLTFFARDRQSVATAMPGDIIGIPSHGTFRIGDALTEGEDLIFKGIPSFAPEYLQRARPVDPMQAPRLSNALVQLAEEGLARIFKTKSSQYWVVGVVGQLQFDILADRIRNEYKVDAKFEEAGMETARWVYADDPKKFQEFLNKHSNEIGEDHDGDPVFMARSAWDLKYAQEKNPDIHFAAVKETIYPSQNSPSAASL